MEMFTSFHRGDTDCIFRQGPKTVFCRTLQALARRRHGPPPPPPVLTNGHKCRPDFPTAPMTRILLPSHVELPPAASSAGHFFHEKAFKTTVGCKEKRLSLKPMAVAA